MCVGTMLFHCLNCYDLNSEDVDNMIIRSRCSASLHPCIN